MAHKESILVTTSLQTNSQVLRRLGFVWKRPKKRLLKADAAQRETFVATYANLRQKAQQGGATIFFVDEAHFRAHVEVRNKWVLRGAPALVDSTSHLGQRPGIPTRPSGTGHGSR